MPPGPGGILARQPLTVRGALPHRLAAVVALLLVAAALLALPDQARSQSTPPTLVSAMVDRDTLVMTFSADLNESSIPGNAKFVVMVDGSRNNVTNASISGPEVTLTLTTAVVNTQTVTVGYTLAPMNPLQDTEGNNVAAFSDQTVETDTTAPTMVYASAQGSSLVMHFDEALNEDATLPGKGKFVVMVGMDRNDVTDASISGSTVTLELMTAVTSGDAVTLRLIVNAGQANKLQDHNGNTVAGFMATMVTNALDAPMLSTATIDGASLVLTYDETLATGSVPAASAYSVTVGGVAGPEPSSVSISGSAATVTLATAVASGQTVTVSYEVQSSRVQDGDGNVAAPLTGRAVTNNTAPALSTATVDGTSLVLTYDGALDTTSVPAAGAYSVAVDGGTGMTPSGVAISGSAVTLTLATAVEHGQTVTVTYTVPAMNPVQAAGDLTASGLSNQAVTNNTAPPAGPALSTATVNGTSLVLTYGRTLDDSSTPATSAFTVKVDGNAGVAPSTVSISGSVVTLTLATAVEHGQTVTVSYAAPSTGNKLQDTDSVAAESFTDHEVTNNSPDTTAPTLSTATVNGTSLA